MNTVLAPIGRFLLAPWCGRAWRDLWFVILSSALSLLPLGLIGLPWAFFARIYLPSVLACAFLSLLAAVVLSVQAPWFLTSWLLLEPLPLLVLV